MYIPLESALTALLWRWSVDNDQASKVYPHTYHSNGTKALLIGVPPDVVGNISSQWIIMSFPTSRVLTIFMATLPSNFRFCNMPHVCHSKFEGIASSWSRLESSFLSDRFRYWKSALCKTEGFCKYESSLCPNHAVIMLTQPGHVDEHLKEQLMSQKEENGNFSWKLSKV